MEVLAQVKLKVVAEVKVEVLPESRWKSWRNQGGSPGGVKAEVLVDV